ncbi:MMPL family transporter [Candidatus Woesearchaeota archaeon]|nr:MMPL family transporter [Candidatus Woesearchaeota archaeon]
MKQTAKQMLKSIRIIILILFVVFSLFAIHPSPGAEGVAIRNVARNSSAMLAGIDSPAPTTTPMAREVILSVNDETIRTEADYYAVISDLKPNRTVQIKTTQGFYQLTTKPLIEVEYLDEWENVTVEETEPVNKTYKYKNGTVFVKEVNETVNKTIEVQKTESRVLGTEDPGISVYQAPKSNVRKGLDLTGGTRVLLRPESKVSNEDMEVVIDNLKERLNVFGLSDVVVREASDLEGSQYVLIEIAGANQEEVRELIAKQGKFEAKVGNSTVFRGGNDITYVCRTADCSGIDPMKGCGQSAPNQWSCAFRFSIALTPESAERQADATRDLDIVVDEESGAEHLSEKLYLYLDDALVDELYIVSDLKGRPATDIMITGGGAGTTQQDAMFNALSNMKRMQTILITGSLPVKMTLEKSDAVSPVLGDDFVRNAFVMAIAALLAVALVIFVRYRKLSIAVPMLITMVAEVLIIFGVAALIQWNIDMAAIAGIIVAVGTGVDDQIVIADETQRGESQKFGWKERLKRAFFIIMVAYFTGVAAMVPLMFAGAGLLKGFALTTILGISIGVFITRPAFAAIVEILLKK